MNKDKEMEKVFSIINSNLQRNSTGEMLYFELERQLGISAEYIDKKFLKKYKMTLRKYIVQCQLNEAYKTWIREGSCHLTERSCVNGIKNFKRKFRKNFGCDPEEALKEKYDLTILLPGGKIYNELENLEEIGYIDSFRITNDGIEMKQTEIQLISNLIRMPKFMIPAFIWEGCLKSIKELDIKQMMIYGLSKAYKCNSVKEVVINLNDDVEKYKFDTLGRYNLDAPYEANGFVYFGPSDLEKFQKIFRDQVNVILPYLKAVECERGIYDVDILKHFIWYKNYCINNDEEIEIEAFSRFVNLNREDAIDRLWKLMMLGFISYPCSDEILSAS